MTHTRSLPSLLQIVQFSLETFLFLHSFSSFTYSPFSLNLISWQLLEKPTRYIVKHPFPQFIYQFHSFPIPFEFHILSPQSNQFTTPFLFCKTISSRIPCKAINLWARAIDYAINFNFNVKFQLFKVHKNILIHQLLFNVLLFYLFLQCTCVLFIPWIKVYEWLNLVQNFVLLCLF